MITPVVHQPHGHRGGRLHLPRLLHRPVPGLRDGEVRPRQPQARQGGDPPGREERVLGRAHGRVRRASSPRWAARSSAPRRYSQGRQDFRAQLTAIKKTQAAGHLRARLLQRRRAHRPPGARAGPEGAADGRRRLGLARSSSSSAARRSRAATSPTTTRPKTRRPRVQNFIEEYKEDYGGVPDALAALGYDAAQVAHRRAEAAPRTLDGPGMRDAIAQTKDFPGVAGTITLDAKRNAVKPAVVLQGRGTASSKYVATGQAREWRATSSSTSSTAWPPAPSTRWSRSATRWSTAC